MARWVWRVHRVYPYLGSLIERLPVVKDPNQCRALLPKNIDHDLISSSRTQPQVHFLSRLHHKRIDRMLN